MFCFELSEFRDFVSFGDKDVGGFLFFILFKERLLVIKFSDTVVISRCFSKVSLCHFKILLPPVWQKPLQYCKVISLQLIKINEKKIKFFFLQGLVEEV